MALISPFMPSSSGPSSAFSPFSDSPTSPVPFHTIPANPSTSQQISSGGATSDTLQPPRSPYPQSVDPSPVDSNGTASTEATEIEDDGAGANEEAQHNGSDFGSPIITSASPLSPDSVPGKIDTALAFRLRADSEGAPQSVIHAPQDFNKHFESPTELPREKRPESLSPANSTNTILSPGSPRSDSPKTGSPKSSSPKTTEESDEKAHASPINTNVPPETQVMPTPRAQTRQELEVEWENWRNRHSMNLEGIPEGQDNDRGEEDEPQDPNEPPSAEETDTLEEKDAAERLQRVNALKDGLTQCWTLCNTLANLSSDHRNQIFNFTGKSEIQEQAWKSCWKLCQNLYESRDDDHKNHVLPTLEMCRDFCQALFEARQKADEPADSVLRVSFELNNHLYNTHDRNLPSPFQERTLDFYLTLCHRLMKQRTSLPRETDTLLRACWSLAEMLFSLRQNNRDGKPPDEELLGSAVQACWDLCDLFREGWSQVRPDRGTPRPSQTSFSPQQGAIQTRKPSSFSDISSNSLAHSNSSIRSLKVNSIRTASMPPETPTTVFDDTNDAVDMDDDDDNRPHILVLGPESNSSGKRWSSASSNYSESSQRTSSTTTVSSSTNLGRIRILLVKSAINCGFQPQSPSAASSTASASGSPHAQSQNQALLAFVKALPSNSFGQQTWQTATLDKYRRLTAAWPTLTQNTRSSSGLSNGRLIQSTQSRASAAEIARAVLWMMRSEQYTWLRDLFRVVFGSFPDDALSMTNLDVQA